MSDDERALYYEAGYLAGLLSWPDPDVVTPTELAALTPTGDPLIVLCGKDGLTTDQARTFAAIHGAGRPGRVVTATALPPDVQAWLPADSLHLIGSSPPEVRHDVGADLTAAASDGGVSLIRQAYEVEMEPWAEGDGDADLLESTPITLNWHVAWYGLNGPLHVPNDSGDWLFERYDPIPGIGALFALPFLIGGAAVLGVATPTGQYFPTADSLHVVTGNWRKRQIENGYGQEWVEGEYATSGFSTTIVSSLINRLEPRDPDPIFASDDNAETMFTNVVAGMLEGITLGLLRHGSDGFQTMKPYLSSWIEQRQLEAVQALRGGS